LLLSSFRTGRARRPILPIISSILAIVFTIPAPAFSQATTTAPGPHIAFNKMSETVTGVAGGDTANFTFEVSNNGSKDLNITGLQPGCGCTVASCPPVIHPGQKSEIKAVMRTQALWGPTTKSLTVYSNDPAEPVVNLTLIAVVVPAVTVTPNDLISVPYDDPAPITRTFTIISHRKDPMAPKLPPATSGPVKVQVDFKNATNPAEPDACHVTLTLTPPASGGDAVGVVEFATGLSGVPSLRITLVALGQKGIAMTPALLDLGLLNTVDKSTGTISLFSRKSKFHITGVESDDPRLKIAYKALPASMTWYTLTATYRGGWPRGQRQGTITIHTDLPGFEVVKAPYWAAVQ